MDILRVTIAGIMAAPNLAELLAEYAEECSLPELGAAAPQFDTYLTLEGAGAIHPFAAFEGDRLCGFIIPIIAPLPHYGVLAATVESFFVAKADRPKNVGLKLMAEVRGLARERGAKAIIMSAPVGSALSQLLALSETHRHSNNTFVEVVA